jgi:hypothetical protein
MDKSLTEIYFYVTNCKERFCRISLPGVFLWLACAAATPAPYVNYSKILASKTCADTLQNTYKR